MQRGLFCQPLQIQRTPRSRWRIRYMGVIERSLAELQFLQLGVFRLSLLEDRDVGVGILP